MNQEQIKAALAWLKELQWADEPDFEEVTDAEVVTAIRRYFDGGIEAFLQTTL